MHRVRLLLIIASASAQSCEDTADFFVGLPTGFPADCAGALAAFASYGTPEAQLCAITVANLLASGTTGGWAPTVAGTVLISESCCAACSASGAGSGEVTTVAAPDCQGQDIPAFFANGPDWLDTNTNECAEVIPFTLDYVVQGVDAWAGVVRSGADLCMLPISAIMPVFCQ